MKSLPILFLILLTSGLLHAQTPTVGETDQVSPVTVSPGVILRELTGRTATANSDRTSVAFFHLEPGRASAWSYTKAGEEAFFILKGRGEIWTGSQAHEVRAGSFIIVPPRMVRSVRASRGEPLEFYAVTTPAWSKEGDVLTTPPIGAPK